MLKKWLRKRSCGERCVGLHKTMSPRTCIPATVTSKTERPRTRSMNLMLGQCPGLKRRIVFPAVRRQWNCCIFEDFFNLSRVSPGFFWKHERGYPCYVWRCKAGSKAEGVVHQSDSAAVNWPRNGNKEAGVRARQVLSRKFPSGQWGDEMWGQIGFRDIVKNPWMNVGS